MKLNKIVEDCIEIKINDIVYFEWYGLKNSFVKGLGNVIYKFHNKSGCCCYEIEYNDKFYYVCPPVDRVESRFRLLSLAI